MQQDFERRGDRGRGDPDRGGYTQRGNDRDYERVYDDYGESSGEYDRQRSRQQGYRDVERESFSDRDRYGQQQRQDRYTDEMRGDSGTGIRQDRGEQHRMEQERFEQGRFDQGRSMRRGDSGQRGYDQRGGGRSGSPYDQGEVSSWYGGDTGMGDTGSSMSGGPSTWGQQGRGRFDRGRSDPGQSGWGQHDRWQSDWDQRGGGQFGQRGGWNTSSQPQASSQWGQRQFDQGQYRDRFSGTQQSGSMGNWQSGNWDETMHGTSGNQRSIEGPFTGRGPRNYHRSDERILEDVSDLLTRHGDIDASQMEVDVHNGVVHLSGMADSGRIRRLTEEVVESVTGVHDVRNDLRVNQRTGYAETMRSDMDPWNQGRTELGRSDWDRGETGRHEMSQGRETSQTGTRQGSTTSTSDTGTSGHGTSTAGSSSTAQTGSQAYAMGPAGGQTSSRSTVRQGMDVVGSDGVVLGQVQEVRGTDFLLNRPMQRDVYVPTSAVQTVDGDRVMLNIPAREVDNQNWPTPDLTSTSQQTR